MPTPSRIAAASQFPTPRVTQSRRHAQRTRREQHHLAERQLRESAVLRRRVLGSATASTRGAQWRARAEQARRDLAEIEALPVIEAARLVRERAARAETELGAAERAQASRDMRAVQLGQFESPSTDHGTKGQERDAPGL